MIKVDLQPEPPDFQEKVREPGVQFLKKKPNPSSKEWKTCWTRARKDLGRAYKDICAYCAVLHEPTARTVDHFHPKSIRPDLAYEWDNYRLACPFMNAFKRDYQDVLDPFTLKPMTFVIDFPSLQVTCGLEDEALRKQVNDTVERLHLNTEEMIEMREKQIGTYVAVRGMTFEYFWSTSPFIAAELDRQKLRERKQILELMPGLDGNVVKV